MNNSGWHLQGYNEETDNWEQARWYGKVDSKTPCQHMLDDLELLSKVTDRNWRLVRVEVWNTADQNPSSRGGAWD